MPAEGLTRKPLLFPLVLEDRCKQSMRKYKTKTKRVRENKGREMGRVGVRERREADFLVLDCWCNEENGTAQEKVRESFSNSIIGSS